VEPGNRASNIFCSALGCRFEKIMFAGVVTYRYTYVLDNQPSEPDAEAVD